MGRGGGGIDEALKFSNEVDYDMQPRKPYYKALH
jgi:hypothetical protein